MSPTNQHPLRELWTHRALVWQFTLRNVELRHKGSHLGLLWSLLGPLLMLGLYVLVFGFIFEGRFRDGASVESRVEYALGVFLGLALHHFVAEVVSQSPGLITANPNFVKKVVFPLGALPVAGVGAAAFHFLITLTLVFGGALAVGVPLSWGSFGWLPVLLIPLFIGAVGLAMGLSALGVYIRDLTPFTQFLGLALLFASAVFYLVSLIPPPIWTFLKFNPLLHLIHEARAVVFWGDPVNLKAVGYLYAVSLLSLAGGAWLFHRLRPSFADVL